MTVDGWVATTYRRGIVHRGLRCKILRWKFAGNLRGVWFFVQFPSGAEDRCYRQLPQKVVAE